MPYLYILCSSTPVILVNNERAIDFCLQSNRTNLGAHGLEGEPLPGERLPRLDGDVDLLVDESLRVARALRLPEQVVHPTAGALHVGSGSEREVRLRMMYSDGFLYFLICICNLLALRESRAVIHL